MCYRGAPPCVPPWWVIFWSQSQARLSSWGTSLWACHTFLLMRQLVNMGSSSPLRNRASRCCEQVQEGFHKFGGGHSLGCRGGKFYSDAESTCQVHTSLARLGAVPAAEWLDQSTYLKSLPHPCHHSLWQPFLFFVKGLEICGLSE